MPKIPKPHAVATPGSKPVPPKKKSSSGGSSGGGRGGSTGSTPAKSPLRQVKKAGRGRPILKKAKKARQPLRERSTYTETDMLEAIRLVTQLGYAVRTAAKVYTEKKLNDVPRQVFTKTGTGT
jgi:hypothetical protein